MEEKICKQCIYFDLKIKMVNSRAVDVAYCISYPMPCDISKRGPKFKPCHLFKEKE